MEQDKALRKPNGNGASTLVCVAVPCRKPFCSVDVSVSLLLFDHTIDLFPVSSCSRTFFDTSIVLDVVTRTRNMQGYELLRRLKRLGL